MIGYITLGTNDLERAKGFYNELLPLLGGKQVMELERLVFWGSGRGKPMLAVCVPYDGEAASAGNGTMVALPAQDRETVNAVYQKALDLGARDEGEPGDRTDNFYGAYFRDLDGNKFVIFCMS